MNDITAENGNSPLEIWQAKRIKELEDVINFHHVARKTIEERFGWKYDGWLHEESEKIVTPL